MDIGPIIGIIVLAVLVLVGYRVGQGFIMISETPAQPTTTGYALPTQQPTNITLRWNHFPLTVYINDTYIKQHPGYESDILQAMNMWEQSTNNLVNFSITNNPNSDIILKWAPGLSEGSTDTLGNTDLNYITIGKFGIIDNAKIDLLTKSGNYQLSDNDMTNLALHELGHSLGLSHTTQKGDIMYPVLDVPSIGIKQISSSDVTTLQNNYKLPPKPDLRISQANVTKIQITRFGVSYYLVNISLVVDNIGIVEAPPSVLEIDADHHQVQLQNIYAIPVGESLSIQYGNVKIDNNFSTIQLILDPNNAIDELNETNNIISLNVT